MKKILNILFLVLLVKVGLAQYTVTPSVINSAGGSGVITVNNKQYIIDYNIGEPIITTVSDANNTITITQGFLQPDSFEVALALVIDSTDETCYGLKDGRIKITNTKNYSMNYKISTNISDTVPCSQTEGCNIDSLLPGVYTYTVYVIGGPTYTYTTTVTAGTERCDIVPYTGFTPNGDGKNDFFYIKNIALYPDNTVTIFNRWGVKVWETTSYHNTNNAWNGTNTQTGNTVASGTYFYVISTKDKDGTTINKGFVEVTGN